MALKDIFKDSNDVNEKNVVGFASFVIMVLFAIADIITALMGITLNIQRFIYDSFLYITLGSFGISEISKVTIKKQSTKTETEDKVIKEEKELVSDEEKDERWF